MGSSFKNLQNKLEKLKEELTPNEPKRRSDAIEYLYVLTELVNNSYIEESTADYMFLKTLHDVVVEMDYFGGFTNQSKETLIIIEKRYNYVYGEGSTNIE